MWASEGKRSGVYIAGADGEQNQATEGLVIAIAAA
jgi:hypothetical protein